METNVVRGLMNLRRLTAVVATLAMAGCNLSKDGAPDLTGPSTLGRSVILSAAPDRILYDGASTTVVTATVRNANGEVEPNVGLRWEADVVSVASGSITLLTIPVEPAPQITTTGANGTATTVVRAPIAPDTMPSTQIMMRVTATPIGDDASQLAPTVDAKPRTVEIELVPLDGELAPNRAPVVDFTISPPSANINQDVTFDASLTRDEGVVCGDNCTYVWDFGSDAKTKSGRIVTQSFPASGTRTVRLYVTDRRGATSSKTQTLQINAPAAPAANFIVIPLQPKIGSAATFDGSSSTVGIGANIVSYTWDFGEDGATGSGKTASYAYTTPGPMNTSKTVNVTLTVTDDLGRSNQKTLSITVIP
jgi:PKD repeat protein